MEKLMTEGLVTEETVEAGTAVVEQVVEEVATNGGSNLLKKCGIVGVGLALTGGAIYAGYKFLKKKKSEKAAEESEEGVVADTECKETSEEIENDSEK